MAKSPWIQVLAGFSFVLAVGGLWRLASSLAARIPASGEMAALLLALGVGAATATVSWHLFRKADRLLDRRIERALCDFRRRLAVEHARQDEARRHLIAGYTQWFEHRDLDAAIAHFERAVRAFPSGLSGYVALGYAYYTRGDTAKAFDLLHRALALYPDRKEPYRDIAGLLIREGELERALEYVERAVKVDPSVRRDLLEDPLFDALKHEERTRARYERALAG